MRAHIGYSAHRQPPIVRGGWRHEAQSELSDYNDARFLITRRVIFFSPYIMCDVKKKFQKLKLKKRLSFCFTRTIKNRPRFFQLYTNRMEIAKKKNVSYEI